MLGALLTMTAALATVTAIDSDRILFDAVLRSYDPDPDLPEKVFALIHRAQQNAEIEEDLGHITDEDLCLLYDRVVAVESMPRYQQTSLFAWWCYGKDSSTFFKRLQACSDNKRPRDGSAKTSALLVRLLRSPDPVTSLLAYFQTTRGGALHLSEEMVLASFHTAQQSRLLCDREVVLALIRHAGVRLRLVDVVQHRHAADLYELLPLYQSVWGPILPPRQSSKRTPGATPLQPGSFLTDLRGLPEDCRQAIWSLPQIRDFFKRRLADLVDRLDGEHGLRLLAEIGFPFLPDLLQTQYSPCGRTLLHWACARADFSTLRYLLIPSAQGIHVHCPSCIVDVNAEDESGRLPVEYLDWDVIARNRDRHLAVLDRLVSVRRPSAWIEVAAELIWTRAAGLLTGRSLRQRLRILVPLLSKEFLVAAQDGVDRRQQVGDHSEAAEALRRHLLEQGKPVPAAQTANIQQLVKLATDHAPEYLRLVVNVCNQDDHNTLLHYAFERDDRRLASMLLAVPGIRTDIRNTAGQVPLHYSTPDTFFRVLAQVRADTGRSLVRSDPFAFVRAVRAKFDTFGVRRCELLIRYLDEIRESFDVARSNAVTAVPVAGRRPAPSRKTSFKEIWSETFCRV